MQAHRDGFIAGHRSGAAMLGLASESPQRWPEEAGLNSTLKSIIDIVTKLMKERSQTASTSSGSKRRSSSAKKAKTKTTKRASKKTAKTKKAAERKTAKEKKAAAKRKAAKKRR